MHIVKAPSETTTCLLRDPRDIEFTEDLDCHHVHNSFPLFVKCGKLIKNKLSCITIIFWKIWTAHMYGTKFLANLESKSKQILHMEEKIEDMFFFMEDAFSLYYCTMIQVSHQK
jgi:hypothetical protein